MDLLTQTSSCNGCRGTFCCSPFIMLYNGLKMSEYKVHWLTDYPIAIGWVHAKKLKVENYGNYSFCALVIKKANRHCQL